MLIISLFLYGVTAQKTTRRPVGEIREKYKI